jgi:hypothetical protein
MGKKRFFAADFIFHRQYASRHPNNRMHGTIITIKINELPSDERNISSLINFL